MEKAKTAEEILAEAHGILPQYLNVHCGKITSERNIAAMKAYARQIAGNVKQACYDKINTGNRVLIKDINVESFIGNPIDDYLK
jgi:hypothetical protein